MKAVGSNGTLHLENNQVRIERHKTFGNFLLQGLQGEKVIPFQNVTAINFRPAGSVVVGYISVRHPWRSTTRRRDGDDQG